MISSLTVRYPFVQQILKERAQGVLSTFRTNASRVKALDLEDLRSAFKDVDWKSFRDVQLRGAKDAVEGMQHMRRNRAAERRNGVMIAAVGAAIGATLMYFCDPGNGTSRRSSARERLKRWYLSGRDQLEHLRRQSQPDSSASERTEKARANGTSLTRAEPPGPQPLSPGRSPRLRADGGS